jgi:hypothetical protein
MVVTTYRPSGETCDMKPTRATAGSELLTSGFSMKELQRITSWLRMTVFLAVETRA